MGEKAVCKPGDKNHKIKGTGPGNTNPDVVEKHAQDGRVRPRRRVPIEWIGPEGGNCQAADGSWGQGNHQAKLLMKQLTLHGGPVPRRLEQLRFVPEQRRYPPVEGRARGDRWGGMLLASKQEAGSKTGRASKTRALVTS
jgi:hypothetical protein